MTKILLYMRHGLKAADNQLAQEGKLMVKMQGEEINLTYYIDHVFCGELVHTRQTLNEILPMLTDQTAPVDHGVIEGVGSDAMFAKMVTPAFKEAVKAGKSNFLALQETTDQETFVAWCAESLEVVKRVFSHINNQSCDDTGLLVGHSPVIEMAAFATAGYEVCALPPEYLALKETEVLVFYQYDSGEIMVVDKMDAPEAAATNN